MDRRTAIQSVRLTPPEQEMISTAAREAGVTVSEFLRLAAVQRARAFIDAVRSREPGLQGVST